MNDFVNREALKRTLKALLKGEIKDILRIVDTESKADVEPVRHGHWIFEGCSVENYKEQIYKCSVCDRWVSILESFEYELCAEYPYCHCGAKMDEEIENKE